jgi:transcriptional regulator with XRE-family HTH domain
MVYETLGLDGEDVRRIRRLLGDTQVQFAKRLGVDPVTVARWETGQRRCSGEYAEAIAKLEGRSRGGKPQSDPATVSVLAQVVRKLFAGSTAQAVSALIDHETLSREELDHLARQIDAKRKKRDKR